MIQDPTSYEMSQDAEFQNFVVRVTPEGQVQQVWLAEAIAILKLLWELFLWLKSKGWFTRWTVTRRVRKVMAISDPKVRERALHALEFDVCNPFHS